MSRYTWCCLLTVISLCTLSVFAYPQNGQADKKWDSSDSGLPISYDEMLSVFENRNRILDSPYFVPSYFDSERRKRGVPTVAVKLLQMGKLLDFPRDIKHEFETAVVNEPSVFEPPKFYCKAAVDLLLKRTTEIPSNDEAIRKFVKVGDFNSAMKDFHAVNPTYVWSWKRNGSDMFEGRAGDRLIFVNSRGEQGLPTITIIDYKKAKVDWIKGPRKDPYGHVTGKPIDRIIYTRPLKDD